MRCPTGQRTYRPPPSVLKTREAIMRRAAGRGKGGSQPAGEGSDTGVAREKMEVGFRRKPWEERRGRRYSLDATEGMYMRCVKLEREPHWMAASREHPFLGYMLAHEADRGGLR